MGSYKDQSKNKNEDKNKVADKIKDQDEVKDALRFFLPLSSLLYLLSSLVKLNLLRS